MDDFGDDNRPYFDYYSSPGSYSSNSELEYANPSSLDSFNDTFDDDDDSSEDSSEVLSNRNECSCICHPVVYINNSSGAATESGNGDEWNDLEEESRVTRDTMDALDEGNSTDVAVVPKGNIAINSSAVTINSSAVTINSSSVTINSSSTVNSCSNISGNSSGMNPVSFYGKSKGGGKNSSKTVVANGGQSSDNICQYASTEAQRKSRGRKDQTNQSRTKDLQALREYFTKPSPAPASVSASSSSQSPNSSFRLVPILNDSNNSAGQTSSGDSS